MHDLSDFYQSVILDHSRRPRNFSVMSDANRVATGSNPMCGDQVTVYLKIEEDRIVDISFQGCGCAISQASASLMTLQLKGRTIVEAGIIFSEVHQLVTTGEIGDDELSELAALAGVHQFPARIKCATLGWHAALDATKSRWSP
jgi:nitrogen fixation NifU-like protein